MQAVRSAGPCHEELAGLVVAVVRGAGQGALLHQPSLLQVRALHHRARRRISPPR
jgi:hypothetical protein